MSDCPHKSDCAGARLNIVAYRCIGCPRAGANPMIAELERFLEEHRAHEAREAAKLSPEQRKIRAALEVAKRSGALYAHPTFCDVLATKPAFVALLEAYGVRLVPNRAIPIGQLLAIAPREDDAATLLRREPRRRS